MGEKGDAVARHKNILRIQIESGEEEIHYPAFYEVLPAEYKLVAEEVLGETAAKKEKGLRTLKEFMKRENLSAPDDVLVAVLRCSKYNCKKSESKLQRYLKLRQNLVQQLCRIDDDEIEAILDVAPFSVLPYRDKDGRAVITTDPPKCLDKYPLDVIEPIGFALCLYLMEFPLTTVCGVSYLGENKDISLKLLIQVLGAFRKYIYFLLDLPTRYGRADICHEMPICRIFFNAVRRILTKKASVRVHFHGSSYKSLHSIYHPDMLPSELEGNLGPRSNKCYKEGLINFIKNLKEESRNNFGN